MNAEDHKFPGSIAKNPRGFGSVSFFSRGWSKFPRVYLPALWRGLIKYAGHSGGAVARQRWWKGTERRTQLLRRWWSGSWEMIPFHRKQNSAGTCARSLCCIYFSAGALDLEESETRSQSRRVCALCVYIWKGLKLNAVSRILMCLSADLALLNLSTFWAKGNELKPCQRDLCLVPRAHCAQRRESAAGNLIKTIIIRANLLSCIKISSGDFSKNCPMD
jgi:hypothetical protein